MYCHICGTPNDADSLFCCNCGERIGNEEQTTSKIGENVSHVDGLILTNTGALAKKFGVSAKRVEEEISSYIVSVREQRGFTYGLIDAREYLSPNDSWMDHVRLLANSIEGNQINPDLLHLYIIGGDDIIPMAVVSLPQGLSADNLDTDIPYAFLIQEDIPFEQYPDTLFGATAFMFVGRLPFATDANLESLAGFLRRSSENAKGLHLSKGFAVENVARKPLTSFVLQPACEMGLFSRYQGASSDWRYAYDELHSSMPNHVDETLERHTGLEQKDCFDYSADFYHVLLHGDDAKTNSQFSGEFLVDDKIAWYPAAVTPSHISRAKKPNIVMTSACFGARFIRFERKHSMLLSALENKTLIYFGASRTSISCCNISNDNMLIGVYPPRKAATSDLLLNQRMANVFIGTLLSDENYTCGMAALKARFSTILPEGDKTVDPSALYDGLIYNLYGDPSLHCTTSYKQEKAAPSVRKLNPVKEYSHRKGENLNFAIENTASAENSLLGKVRGLVDANILKIRESVDEHLYANFKVDPRSLNGIFKVRHKSGVERLRFLYRETAAGRTSLHIVQTTLKGDILSVAVNS